jgi:hypothetical protein
MILRGSGLLFASAFTTGVSLAMWGIAVASIGQSDTVALADDRMGALALTVLSAALLGLCWLRGGRGVLYLLDLLLTQRAQNRDRKPPTVPFRVVR